MKKIWIVTTCVYNGTVLMNKDSCAVATKELAEETKKAVDKANEGNCNGFSIHTDIQESNLYESREEVPILNK